MQKLIEYRNKAKIATIISAAIAILFVVIYVGLVSTAQANYYDAISSYDSLYDFAAQRLTESMSNAQPALYLGVLSSAVSGISLMLWMLANLLIAYKTPDK